MHCLLVYDIPDDRLRTKVADFCLDYGLDRVQYSAFVGPISRNHAEELMAKIRSRVGQAPARVLILAIPDDVWEDRLVHEQAE